jgi:hypothetical protein
MPELQMIDFLAQLINQQVSLQQGYTAPTRWLTLREDLRIEYTERAKKMFNDWRDEEIAAKASRDAITDSIKIKYY